MNHIDEVPVLLEQLDPELPVPGYARPGDAGADLYARIDIELDPGQRALVPTGIAIALPAGYAAFVHPRSGLSVSLGLGMVNAPGTIDAGYRGEISVNLINHDRSRSIVLHRGDRIAQLIVTRVSYAQFITVEQLPGSDRGKSGFGSTGHRSD